MPEVPSIRSSYKYWPSTLERGFFGWISLFSCSKCQRKSQKPTIYMFFLKPKIFLIAGRKSLPAHHSHLSQVWSTLANYPEKCSRPMQNKEWQCPEKNDTKNILTAWFWGFFTHFSILKVQTQAGLSQKRMTPWPNRMTHSWRCCTNNCK